MLTHTPPKRTFLPNLDRSEPLMHDHTSMITAMNCWRKYFYRFVLGRVPHSQYYQLIFDFGSAYHKFRELLETKDYITAMGYILQVKLPPPPNQKWEFLDHKRLIASCQKAYEYVKKEKENGRIKVVAVEQPFNLEMPDGSFIGGRADQIVEWNGKLWGRDFKTTSKTETEFAKGFDPNDQVMRYTYAESKLHGAQVQGILIEGLHNSKTKGPYIFVQPQSRSSWQLKQWETEQIMHHKLLSVCREEDIWPMNPHNCGFCDYAKACRASSEPALEAILKTDFKYQPWDHNKVDQ